MNVLITGTTGFVGNSVLNLSLEEGHSIVTLGRKLSEYEDAKANFKQIICSDLSKLFVSESSDELKALNKALQNIDVILHTAARVHILNDSGNEDLLSEFRKLNTTATFELAKRAAHVGVKRFIFISSIKVNGEMTELGKPFKPSDDFIPNDPYGLSKYEAEQGLLALAKETGMEVVIIRPPLVYGPGVRANFASMMKWVNKGIPLPFGTIDNKRSLVALDNLVNFIIHCIDHPKAANEIFLISDGEDVSTTELLRKVANAFGKKALLLPVPVSLMRFAAKLIGKADVANRLFGSLRVDSSKARDLLDWKPVVTMDEQLKKTADAYLENEKTL